MTIITPTVGRIVWFWPPVPPQEQQVEQPLAAIVTHVQDDRLINITAFTPDGVPVARTDVQLVQDGDPKPRGNYAEWMPYQLGQAKKHAA